MGGVPNGASPMESQCEFNGNSMGFNGTQWDSMGLNGTQWDSMGLNGNPMGLNENSMRTQ